MCVCMCVSVCARVSVYSLFIAAIRSNNQGKTTQFALFVFHTHTDACENEDENNLK